MIPRVTAVLVIGLLVGVLLPGCGQGSPASGPAQPAASAAKPTAASTSGASAAPTQAPAAASAPTKQAAPAANWPQKDRTATIIVVFAAGGANDVQARLTAPLLEKELGIPIQVVNKPGASSQIGTSELARSKPDGYTISVASNISQLGTYLDPSKKADYGRKDLKQVALQSDVPMALIVGKDSPYKDAKEFIAAAKAKPNSIKVAATGPMGDTHLASILLQKKTDIKLSVVQFDGSGSSSTALAGGHVDAVVASEASLASLLKAGKARTIGVMASERFKLSPDVPTFKEMGYDVVLPGPRGWIVPAATPKEVVDRWAAAIKKVMGDPDLTKKMAEGGMPHTYLGPEEFTKYWDDLEVQMKPLIEQALIDLKAQ